MYKSAPTLYQHIFRTLFAALLFYLLLVIMAAVAFLMYPVINNSVEELTHLITDSTSQWQQLSATGQAQYATQLYNRNKIRLQNEKPAQAGRVYLPYVLLLESRLTRQSGQNIKFFTTEQDTTWYWTRITVNQSPVYISFSRDRIGTRPPLFFVAVLLFGILLSIVTSMYLARRVTSAIRHLVKAAGQLSQGQLPDAIPET
ncbi:MAG: hypothetical protein HYZ31_03025, partial [Gammaproteobacteria bacterium]|nr:hypothetical protein [Gammaproteobacteria bacterium]